MKTKLSVSRCCCVTVCDKPLCWFDSFNSYTTGDDLVDIANPPYSDTLIADTKAIVSASDTLLISPLVTNVSNCGIDRGWGVDSDGVDATFLQGAANKSVFSIDLLDLDTTQQGAVLDRPRVLIGPQSIGIQHAIEFLPHVGPFADPDKTDRNFVYHNGTSGRRVSIDTLTAPDDLFPVNYKVQIFDGTKVSPDSYSFGWEVLFDDVVVASSTDSGNDDLVISVTDEFVAGDGWCLDPTFRIKIDPFYDYTVMEIDNLFVGINGNDSCAPTIPPV